MTVGELRKALAKLPDDMVVVTHGDDHSFNIINGAWEETVEVYKHRYYEMDSADKPKVQVFVVSAE